MHHGSVLTDLVGINEVNYRNVFTSKTINKEYLVAVDEVFEDDVDNFLEVVDLHVEEDVALLQVGPTNSFS